MASLSGNWVDHLELKRNFTLLNKVDRRIRLFLLPENELIRRALQLVDDWNRTVNHFISEITEQRTLLEDEAVCFRQQLFLEWSG